ADRRRSRLARPRHAPDGNRRGDDLPRRSPAGSDMEPRERHRPIHLQERRGGENPPVPRPDVGSRHPERLGDSEPVKPGTRSIAGMKLGVIVSPAAGWSYPEISELARSAERSGFGSFWV